VTASRRRRGRLTARLLLFNLLLVFLPIGGLLFLGPYERQLLESQERSMVQQGRLLAAALGAGPLDAERSRAVLAALEGRTEARLRVLDADARLLADSSLLAPRRERPAEGSPAEDASRIRENPLYAFGALPFAVWNRLRGGDGLEGAEPGEYYATRESLDGPEIAAALAGRYGAATRIAPGPQRAVILYSALPIRDASAATVGAVLVSQSTLRILAQLYEIRLTIFLVFLASVASAVVLSLFLAGTITRPLRALAGEARALVDGRGRLRGPIRGVAGGGEIGNLSEALSELTRRLEARQRASEALAADLSHELKNPLASIRAATELLAGAETAEERRRFAGMVADDVSRAERLLAGAREIVHLDAPEESPTPVDLGELASSIAASFSRLRPEGPAIEASRPDGDVVVLGSTERIATAVQNLLDNAVGFTPAEGTVRVSVRTEGDEAVLHVDDSGPGVPEEHLARLFQRFFSWRPDATPREAREHSGLGLAIVRAVAEAHGGSVAASNLDEGGARFELRLPLA